MVFKKDIRNKKSSTKLEKLKDIGLSKPEPSNKSIDDVTRKMNRRNFLVRPTYQRVEVIDKQKKSSIIESVLLGIKLPPIFIYKRLDDVYEVIDGQQRLLTLLGFVAIYIAAALTLWSMVHYLRAAWPQLSAGEDK